MKFSQSLIAASALVYGAQAAGIDTVLDVFGSGMLSDWTFYRNFLMQLQRDTGNETTDCIVAFDDMESMYADLSTSLQDDTEYYAGLAAKGQGEGTQVGYAMDKFTKYIDMTTAFTNVYNNCDVDYYAIALSKATSNVSGFANQAVNIYWRTQEEAVYEDLEDALTSGDQSETAAALGQFVKDLLMAEIPDASSASSYVSVGQLY